MTNLDKTFTERDNARKYFEGAVMAYKDCADIASKISDKMRDGKEGFLAASAHLGLAKELAEVAASSGETALRQMAASIRTKLAMVEAALTIAGSGK